MEARYRGREKYYPGRVSKDRGDGTYDIDYDDGEKEVRVKESLIRLLDAIKRRSRSAGLVSSASSNSAYSLCRALTTYIYISNEYGRYNNNYYKVFARQMDGSFGDNAVSKLEARAIVSHLLDLCYLCKIINTLNLRVCR